MLYVYPLYYKVVKLSSPKLNYFIIAGAMLMYISIIFYLLSNTDESITLARCIVSNGHHCMIRIR